MPVYKLRLILNTNHADDIDSQLNSRVIAGCVEVQLNIDPGDQQVNQQCGNDECVQPSFIDDLLQRWNKWIRDATQSA